MEKLWSYIENKPEPSKHIQLMRKLYFSPDDKIGQIRQEFDNCSIDDLKDLYEKLSLLKCGDDLQFILGEGELDIMNEAYGQSEAAHFIWHKLSAKKSTFF